MALRLGYAAIVGPDRKPARSDLPLPTRLSEDVMMQHESNDSTLSGIDAEGPSILTSFFFDIREATTMLMYGLAGIDVYRNASVPHKDLVAVPELLGVNLYPTILRTTPYHQLGPQADPSQIVYKGWMDHIYALWEHKYRNELRAAFKASGVQDAIRPQVSVMGDFRHIRNDFVHDGVAKAEHSGLCTNLRWFSIGDEIALNFGHVMDFLNHVGALDRELQVVGGEPRIHVWRLRGSEEDLLRAEPVLASARLRDESPLEGSLGVSLAFDNGVFGQIAFTFPGASNQQIDAGGQREIDISADGREMLIDKGAFTVTAREPYAKCVAAWFHPDQTVSGPGMLDFQLRFR